MNSKHTPLPWIIEETPDNLYIGDNKFGSKKVNEIVAKFGIEDTCKSSYIGKQIDNAKLIVTAVNNHSALVEALKVFSNADVYDGKINFNIWQQDTLRSLLNKIEGE